jgi:hypothetical protein
MRGSLSIPTQTKVLNKPVVSTSAGNTPSHTFSVKTCRRHGTHGSSGYHIIVTPPIEYTTAGEDIEGIGFVPHRGGTRLRRIPSMGNQQ